MVSQVPAPQEAVVKRVDRPAQRLQVVEEQAGGVLEDVHPAFSNRVFVDVASYNSKVYFVQGDLGAPGRLPFTGSETVLDALQYGGGLTANAEPKDIHLYRPARGGKPARDYKIDLFAILKGDATANLQLFPGDRLVIGRNTVVQRAIDIDRATASVNSVFNSALQKSFTTRSMGAATGLINETTEAQRDAALKEWSEFLWNLSSPEGGALLDDKAFREAVLKKLGPPAPK